MADARAAGAASLGARGARGQEAARSGPRAAVSLRHTQLEGDTLIITAAHTIIYAKDAEKARAFFRDVLKLKSADAGGGWLIFALPPAELAFHPATEGGKHELYFMCDDIEQTIAWLKGKGVSVTKPISDQSWGRLSAFEIPGAGEMQIYQPKHSSPLAR